MLPINKKNLLVKLQEIGHLYRSQIIVLGSAALLIGGGFLLQNYFGKTPNSSTGLQNILGNSVVVDTVDTSNQSSLKVSTSSKGEVIIEMAGEILKPGVYHLPPNSRVQDALIASGGVGADADREWVERNINLAARLSDGQKIYIPSKQSLAVSANNSVGNSNVAQSINISDSNIVSINSASLNELDGLPGIGPVYAQKIIDNRPYSESSELVSKKVIPQSTFEKIKDKISL